MHSRKVIQRLQREGWTLARVSGSHHQFVHPDKPGRRVTVVHPKKDLNIKTLRSIMKQAGWENL
jgi:predicted RNA binding protein YcfA (HicA-like mRNA interferase family)